MNDPAELAREQAAVDGIYQILDDARRRYRQRQRQIQAHGATGSPQNRSERDVMAAHLGDQAARLERVEENLVFGRLTPLQGESYYIGRVGLQDDNHAQVLMDWRARAATPFYQATARHPLGMASRRHIGLHRRQVISLEDEAFDLSHAREEGIELQGEGALLAALQAGRSGHMGDIVATIQGEQDRIIRAATSQILVIQGGPGTGKTAVALHRAAFLLYEQAERLAKSGVLIVGPSPAFLRYIEQVLPALGETGVVSTTMATLLPGIRANGKEHPAISALKGDLRWVKLIKQAVRSLQRVPDADQNLTVGASKLVLRPKTVKEAIRRARLSGKPHNQAREIFVAQVLDSLTDQYLDTENRREEAELAAAASSAGLGKIETNRDSLSERALVREDLRSNLNVRRAVNLCWMPYSAQNLLRRLYAYPAFLARFASDFSDAEQEILYRLKEAEFTPADVPLLDELAELLGELPNASSPSSRKDRALARQQEQSRAQAAIEGQGLGAGIVSAEMLANRASAPREQSSLAEMAYQDRTWTYGHVVVDEAQELSPMDWRCLLRRCPSRSFTVVGDLAQRISAGGSSWLQLLGPAADALEEETYLTVCYRTPKEIMDLAEAVTRAAGRPSPYPVQAVRQDPDSLLTERVTAIDAATVEKTLKTELEYLDSCLGKGRGRIGIICSQKDLPAFQQLSSQLAFTVGGDPVSDRVCILDAVTSKGLEFDSVILLEPAHICAQSVGNLFVAMTRPTRRLVTLHSQGLPPGWE
ncbi:AAA family ATPase [uncultured Varibaculum sp.]|uniref:HelD family protein n=1 Tax=uncultured Varibaculum sp. TaxID=413896 RepID=UPI002593388A|nr:AAA family ATPase [uncultured Varibaculum sp.]